MSRSSLKPSRRVRPAVARAARPSLVKPYPRPPVGDGDLITRQCVEMYVPAWKRLTRKPHGKEPARVPAD